MKPLNPNIPEAVRAVASDGTQLRYTLMEMAKEMPDVISLGRGDPDLPTPQHIIEAANRAMKDQRTGLTPAAGLPELREAIARRFRDENHIPVERDNIIITAGGQEGLFLAIQALIDPGDEILVPDPRYTSYDDAILRAGGKMVMVPTVREDAFNMSAEAIEAAITPKTKAILIVSPNNPTAGIVTEDRLKDIAALAERHNLIVISDEIYDKCVFAPHKHVSIGSMPGMAERTITLNAFSKTYAMTGWRVGFAAAPKNFIEAMTKIKQLTTGPAATVSQWAGLEAVNGPQDCVREYLQIYTERRATLMNGLSEMGFAYGEPRGGLFMWVESSTTGIHSMELSYLLLKEGRVLIFPGTAFGEKWTDYIRVTLLEPNEILREAVERMRPVVEQYRV